jgi:hypothetical protein
MNSRGPQQRQPPKSTTHSQSNQNGIVSSSVSTHPPDRLKSRNQQQQLRIGNSLSSSTGSHNNNNSLSRRKVYIRITCVVVVMTLMISWFRYVIQHVTHPHDAKTNQSNTFTTTTTLSTSNDFCTFRRYPRHRYYKLYTDMPDFLVSDDVEYIYGIYPTLLEPKMKRFTLTSKKSYTIRKLCVNQSEWWNYPSGVSASSSSSLPSQPQAQQQQQQQQQQGSPPLTTTTVTWPFADGTNPSIILMQRLQAQAPDIANMIMQHFPTTYCVVTVCMTNSQCTWRDQIDNDTNQNDKKDPSNNNMYDLPDLQQTQPNTVRTVLQLLNGKYEKLIETTIYLQRDAAWGKKVKRIDDTSSKEYRSYIPALDDARLFVYQSRLFVSYREGPGFGYDVQVLNPIHMGIETEMTTVNKKVSMKHIVSATIRASESASFCCGRNMALLVPDYDGKVSVGKKARSSPQQQQEQQSKLLYALTWVDPVTVEQVDTTPIHQKQRIVTQNHRRLELAMMNSTDTASTPDGSFAQSILFDHPSHHYDHRQLNEKVHKSHIHGTNAFMVPIPSTSRRDKNERIYLGVAHFHRPNDRKPNVYARFGHHYTHAFYTISTTSATFRSSTSTNNQIDLSSFRLKALSSEFILRSNVPDQDEDGEIIQFISGLEYDSKTKQIIVSYGINDCEGAIHSMDYSIVQQLLRPVPIGKQVVDLMMPLLQQPIAVKPK